VALQKTDLRFLQLTVSYNMSRPTITMIYKTINALNWILKGFKWQCKHQMSFQYSLKQHGKSTQLQKLYLFVEKLFILQYTIVYKQDTLLLFWAGNSTEKQLYSTARRPFIMLKIWNKSSVQSKSQSKCSYKFQLWIRS